MHRFRVLVGHYAPHIGVLAMAALLALPAKLILDSGVHVTTVIPENGTEWAWAMTTFLLATMISQWLSSQREYHHRYQCPRCDRLGRRHAERDRVGPATIGQRLFHLRDSFATAVTVLLLLIGSTIAICFVPAAVIVPIIVSGLTYFAAAAHQATIRSCPLCPGAEEVYFRPDSGERWCNEAHFATVYHQATRGADTALLRCERSAHCADVLERFSSYPRALAWVITHAEDAHAPASTVKFSIRPNVPLASLATQEPS